MFNDLFTEFAKELIKPVDNPDERMIMAKGYARHAELRFAETLKTVRDALARDPGHALIVLDSRIAELEAPREEPRAA